MAVLLVPLLYLLAVLGLLHETVASMLRIWTEGETFAHGFLILPISLWLLWRDREKLKLLPARPNPWISVLTLSGVMLWFLGWLVDVNLVQQLALVWILVTGVWALVGTVLAREMAFPLAFLFLAVPMGEGLIPPMMSLTADSLEYFVRLTGVPVFREGMYLTLPTGRWSVVEACSGVRYLIASFTLGLLYAYLSYQSLWRRSAFVLAAIIVPIVANSLRAFGIVMIGHLSNMKLATGVDHLIYGWLFFGVVMLLLFWIGSFWQEPVSTHPENPPELPRAESRGIGSRFAFGTLLLLLVIVAAGPLVSLQLSRGEAAPFSPLQMPEPATGWSDAGDLYWGWMPSQPGADREKQWYFEGPAPVMLGVYQYFNQVPGVELATSGEFWRADRKAWRLVAENEVSVTLESRQVLVDEAVLDGVADRQRLLVWSWYRVDGRYLRDPYWVKVIEARQMLLRGSREGSRVFVAIPTGTDLAEARRVLQEFLDAHVSALGSALDTR
ncbi:exosortase A [Haliea sp.]